MTRLSSAGLAALLLAAPLAFATHGSAPVPFCEPPTLWADHQYSGSAPAAGGAGDVSDGNVLGACPATGDYDGHHEWGRGTAILTAAHSAFPACQTEAAHHADGTIYVHDTVLGYNGTFTVAVDDFDAATGGPGCDGVIDTGKSLAADAARMDAVLQCTGWCDPPFPPGADGAFWVFIDAPASDGHVWMA